MALSAFARITGAAVLVALGFAIAPAYAGETWDGIRHEVFGARAIATAPGLIDFKAPYRPDDVMAVPLAAEVALTNGRTIRAITFIVDENPSPVAASFKLGPAREKAAITTHIRLDQASDVRVVVEASDGALYMAERHIKFAGGQASCSAPPNGEPAEIAANMGKMDLARLSPPAAASNAMQRVRYELNHPNHTGMVLDQITLLYTPLLMVSKLEARQGDDLVFEMAGSITLSQNPAVEFDYRTNGSETLTFVATDTDGKSWQRSFPVGAGS